MGRISTAVALGLAVVLCANGQDMLDATARPDSASRDQRKENVVDLDRIVVTASRTERLISETPVSVSVVAREEIDASPAKNVDDLIATKTGVQMKRVVGIGEGIPSDIIMRGIPGSLAASRTLVLVDGIPTNASGTPFLILNVVPIDAVERVEVVRGPYSCLYGANAFGGVVNILSREGDGPPGAELSFETMFPFSVAHQYVTVGRSGTEALRVGARESYYNTTATSEGGNERLNYLAGVSYRTIGNYLVRDSGFVRTPDTAYYKNNRNFDYRDFRVFAKGGFRIGDRLGTTLHARYFNSDLGFGETKNIWGDRSKGTDSIRTTFGLVDDSVDVVTLGEVFLVGPSVRWTATDNLDVDAATFYRRVNGEFYNEGLDTVVAPPDTHSLYVPSCWRSASNDWQIQARAVLRAGDAHVVTAGFEYLLNSINFGATIDPTRGDTLLNSYGTTESISNAGVYLQDEMSFADRLNVVPGVRLDYHSGFGVALSPKVGMAYRVIDELRIRVSGGRAFRAPALSELYMPDLTVKPGFVVVPNPDLTPEYLWALDGGVEVRPVQPLSFSAGGFYNWMRDLIVPGIVDDDVDKLWTEGGKVTQRNANRAWSWGVELSAEWQAVDWLNMWGNFVYQQSRDVTASAIRKAFIDYDGDPRRQTFGSGNEFARDADWRVPLDYLPTTSGGLGLRFSREIGRARLTGGITESYVGERSFLEYAGLKPNLSEPDTVDRQFWIDRESGSWTVKYINPPLVTLDPYWRTDLSVTLAFDERFSVGLNIQNLFNARFEESLGTLAPGRFATVELRYHF